MININIKSNKGITMITLIIAILIMLVISSTLIYNIKMGADTRDLNNMYSDIQLLKDKIDLYYSSYGALPVIQTEYTNTNNIIGINQNDENKYYVIDLEAFENLTLNYGEGYKEFKTTLSSDIVDIYIVNEQSHNIYYVKGITLDSKIYYTIPGEYTKVELPSIASISSSSINGNVATLTIKGVNKRHGISAIKLYVAGTEYKAYNYDTNNTEMKTETVQIENLEFGEDTYCYIEVTDTEGQTVQSEVLTIKNEDTIATAKDLRKFATLVNEGNTFEGKAIKQIADINLQCSETNQWTPIGNIDTNFCFNGTYDGNNHTISEIYIDNSSDFQALFSVLGEKGTIKNLKVSGNIIGNSWIAGIIAYNQGNIINCVNSCTIVGNGDHVAGISAGNYNGVISKCINLGTITANKIENFEDQGGITASNAGTVRLCINKGTIINNALIGYDVGGIVGQNIGGENSIIENCYNIGEIKSNNIGRLGGIVGWNWSGTTKNCYNIGNVSEREDYGGVVGSNNTAYIGTVTNTYYLSGTCSKGIGYGTGEATEKTSEQLKGLAGTLGSEFITDSENINSGYPILKWQLEQSVQ